MISIKNKTVQDNIGHALSRLAGHLSRCYNLTITGDHKFNHSIIGYFELNNKNIQRLSFINMRLSWTTIEGIFCKLPQLKYVLFKDCTIGYMPASPPIHIPSNIHSIDVIISDDNRYDNDDFVDGFIVNQHQLINNS